MSRDTILPLVWRESIHDDLVLSVALACWYAEQYKPVPIVSPGSVPKTSIWRTHENTGMR